MSYEREIIQHIWSEVDRYDKHQQLYGGEEATTVKPPNITEPRATLCSQVGPQATASAYGILVSEDLGIKDFITRLRELFQGRVHPNTRFGQVSC